MHKTFKRYRLQYGGTNKICSDEYTKDNILNDCIKYDFGDNGITDKRNQVAELRDIAAKKIILNILDGYKPYNNLTRDELNAYLCLTGNIHNTDGILLQSDGNEINEACDEIGLNEIDIPNGDTSNFISCMDGNAGHNENGIILRHKGDAFITNNVNITHSELLHRYEDNGNRLVYDYCNTNKSNQSNQSNQSSESYKLPKFKYINPQITACTNKQGKWNEGKGICEVSNLNESDKLPKFKYIDPQITACTNKQGKWNEGKGICELSNLSESDKLPTFKYIDPQIIACTNKQGKWNKGKGICEI